MSIKIDQIFGGDNAIRLDYLTIDGYNDPTAISDTGTIYAKDVDGYTELFYFDDYGNSIQITSKGSIVGGTGNTLDQAYDQGGAGAGRVIVADSGAVEIDANGADALSLDGYISLNEITNPTGMSNKGIIYSKNDDEYNTSELFYMDDSGQVTQLTQDGYLATYNSLKGVGLFEQAGNPPVAADKGYIYTKDESGDTELFYLDDSGNAVQITRDGFIIGTNISTQDTKEPTGFPNVTASDISFNDGYRRFTIAPTSGSFYYFSQGDKVIKITENVIIDDTDGPWFIYYNSSDVLVSSQTPWSITDDVLVAIVYWNSSDGYGQLGEERHGLTMDNATHSYLHRTLGARFISGFTISGYTLNTATDDAVTIGMENGVFADEDLTHSIVDGYINNYLEQPLSEPAQIPIYYRVGANGIWSKDFADNFFMKNFAVGQLVAFNEFTGGAWQQTEISNTNYVGYWLVATNNIAEPIISVQGQSEDNTLSNAQSNQVWENLSFGDIPFQEMKVLFRLIVQTRNTYSNTPKCRIVDVLDLRTTASPTAGTYVASAHGALSGLSTSGHPASIISTDTTNFDGILDANDTTVQLALESIDDVINNPIPMIPQAGDPASYDPDGYLYSKDVSDYTELFYMDNYGNAIQVTNQGLVDITVHTDDTNNPHATDIGNLGSGTLAELNAIVSDATLIDSTLLDSYATPDVVDGYALTSALTSHTGNTANPHATDIGNLGSGTLAELNTAVSDATLIDSSLLDSYATPDVVDGYALTTALTDHTGNTANPHATDIGNLGSGTLVELNSAVSDATLIDSSLLDSYATPDIVDGYSLTSALTSHTGDTANPHSTDIGNLGSGTLAELNTAVTDATLIDSSLLDSYATTSIVDGYALESDLTSHTGDTANPHSTDIGNLGSGTLSELNSIVSDATLVDSSLLDSYATPDVVDGYALTSALTSHTSDTANPHATDIGNLGGGTLAELNTAVNDATLIDSSLLDSYATPDVVDGYALESDLTSHTGDTANPHSTDVGNLGSGTLAELNTVITDATLIDSSLLDNYATPDVVDGYALTSALTSHTGDTANPHSTDIGNLGSGTLAELNAAVSDATLIDSSLLDSYATPDVVDGYALTTALTSHTSDTANPHVVTLDQSYDGAGSGAGRTITVDSGAIIISASGDQALDIDGYISLSEISDPGVLGNTGMIYTKDEGGDTELYYFDAAGNAVQITKDGVVNASASGNTLNQAYDQGGAGAGRTITADSGAVVIDASGTDALNLDGYLSLDEITDPSGISNKGLIYSKEVDYYTELFYMDNYGNAIQITNEGEVENTTAPVDAYEINLSTAVGTETYIETIETPYSEDSVTLARNGVLMHRVLVAPTGLLEFYYDSIQERVEFNAAGEESWYQLRFTTTAGGGGGGGSSTFVDLTDTPSSYSGKYGYYPRVNIGEDALEFVQDNYIDGYLKLPEADGNPIAVVNDGYLYSKDDGGDTELFYLDDSGNAVQITKDGLVNITVHTNNTNNPHSTDIGNLGSGTLAELNSIVTDATLIDSSLLDSYATPDVVDGYALTSALTSHTSDTTNPHTVTLDQSYDGAGSGAGRTITADSGAVVIDANGTDALELDGYISLNEITNPTGMSNKGIIYSKNDDEYNTSELFYMDDSGQITQITQDGYLATYNSLKGVGLYEQVGNPPTAADKGYIYTKDESGDTELFYLDDSGNAVQITKDGAVNAAAEGNTLNQAYDQGGAGVGRVIIADSGAVEIDASGAAALDLDGYISLGEISAPSALDNKGLLYSGDSDGYSELFYLDNYGNSIQVTEGGFLKSPMDAYEKNLVTADGTETYMETTEIPLFEDSITLARNGVLMRRVDSSPDGYNEFNYNSGLERVEFNAPAEESWYQLRFDKRAT